MKKGRWIRGRFYRHVGEPLRKPRQFPQHPPFSRGEKKRRKADDIRDLLSLIISQPILQAGDTQTVWSKEEVHDAGKQYLQWMHEIRHRGTFSKVALAFASLVDAVKTAPSLKDLAQRWLEVSYIHVS